MSHIPNKTVLLSSKTMINEGGGELGTEAVLEPYLIILSGYDRGRHVRLDKPSYIFGRSDEADIVIGDPKISRKHGVFSVFHQGVLFEDLKSTNGTFIAGQRIEKHWLSMQDRILAGDTVMRIDYKCFNEAESVQALYQAAYTDGLTGILNRGAFMQRAHEEFSFCKRNHALLSILMCDVDHFKRTNDNFGHLAGDHILKELSVIFAEQMRKEDLLARFGGEEFIMLLRETPSQAAENWAERVRQTVMQHPFTYQNNSIPTTISIGLCTQRIQSSDSLSNLIRIADDALYLAKQKGRNRLEVVLAL